MSVLVLSVLQENDPNLQRQTLSIEAEQVFMIVVRSHLYHVLPEPTSVYKLGETLLYLNFCDPAGSPQVIKLSPYLQTGGKLIVLKKVNLVCPL